MPNLSRPGQIQVGIGIQCWSGRHPFVVLAKNCILAGDLAANPERTLGMHKTLHQGLVNQPRPRL
jgi:hypothetical protein